MTFDLTAIGPIRPSTADPAIEATPRPDGCAGPPLFAEFYGGKIGMFDTKTEKFQEWPVPTPHTAPYDVVLDKNGEVWGGGMETDRIMRMDPKTGQFTEYLLPA